MQNLTYETIRSLFPSLFGPQGWTISKDARRFGKKAERGSLCNRIKPYEKNSYLHTSLKSGNAEHRIGVTPDVVYGLDGNCGALETAPRGASGNV